MSAADYVALSRHLEETLGVPPLVRVNGKRPLDAEWTTGPRRDPSGWRRRLTEHDGNVGLLTGSGLVAVDADLYHDGCEDSLDALYDLGLPRHTVTGITGGGGRHLLYRTDAAVASRALDGYPGIDIKGEGGMVVVAPSVHPISGRVYEWEFGWSPDDLKPAELPGALVDLFGAGGHRSTGDLDERDDEAVRLLVEHFHGHSPQQRNGYYEVTRPGKPARTGGSATVGAVGRGVVRVWSSNWDGLPAGVHTLTSLRRAAGVQAPRVRVPELVPPPGYRWWRQGDDVLPPPQLHRDAYHGAVGAYMAHIEQHSEAHPAAVGFTIYAYLGTWLERSVVYAAGRAIRHHPALWGALVGETSSGGKGVAGDVAELFLNALDPFLVKGHSINGIASGQALIDRLRPVEEGGTARRVVVHEHELGNVLRLCEREGSTLSGDLRKAFDLKPLGNLTREHGDRTVEGYFLGAIGSITPIELRHLLTAVSIENGFANRWLLLHCEAGPPMSLGDTIDESVVDALVDQLMSTMGRAVGVTYTITPEVGELWTPFYVQRRTGLRDQSSLVRVFANRQPAHAARLAITFAALDGSPTLQPEHVAAAIAWCDYSLDTVRYVFGEDASGDGQRLLDAIRAAGPEGLDGTRQRDVFARNLGGDVLEQLRRDLERRHLVHTVEVPTRGRPRRVSFAIQRVEGYDQTTKRPKGQT